MLFSKTKRDTDVSDDRIDQFKVEILKLLKQSERARKIFAELVSIFRVNNCRDE